MTGLMWFALGMLTEVAWASFVWWLVGRER